MKMRVCLVLVAVFGLGAAHQNGQPTEDKDWWNAGITVAQRSLQECEVAKDVASCLKIKALRVVDRALNTGPVSLFGGVSLVKREDTEARSFHSLPAIPRDTARRSDQLDDLLAGRIARFFETRTLQVSLPKVVDGVGEVFEGRKKLKKMAGPMILIMVMAAYKLAMVMAGIAMLSGKALIVSKVALTLAGVAVLKKLLSHGQDKTTVEIVKTPQVSHSHSYSQHDEGEHGYHDKSWNIGPMAGYSHRSLTDESADALGVQQAAMLPQEMGIKRDYRSVAAPALAPVNYVTGRGVESLSIRSHDPLRIVVEDNGEEDIRVHHRQRQLDLPLDEPVDYSQFGEADKGAWRGIGNAIPMAGDSRSLSGRVILSSEQQERSTQNESHKATDYHPRSLNNISSPAAA